MGLIDMFLERKTLISMRPVRLALLRSSKRVFIERGAEFVADIISDTVGNITKVGVRAVVRDAIMRRR